MMSMRAAVIATLFSTAAILPAHGQEVGKAAPEISIESVSADIAQLDKDIAEAEADAARYEGGLVHVLALARAETMKLTRAIMQNRIEAQRGGAVVEISVPATPPDPERAAAVLQEIEAQKSVIEQTEREAAAGSGLVGALAQSRVQTEKLTLATLKATWFQAQYGMMLPAAMPEGAPAPSPESEQPAQEKPADASTPEWTDPAHPEIDYTRPLFQQLASEGFKISGWWGILESRAEVDDTPKVLAVNLSAYKDGFQVSQPRLLVQCSEGSASVVYDADDYLLTEYSVDHIPVTYRIDNDDAVSDRWSKLTSSKGGGLFEGRSQDMIRKLYNADQLFARIVENNGKRHDATFDLAGARTALDAVAAACGFSTLSLTTADYRSIQTMLNAAGFDAGTPDGVWGSGSSSAMRTYQAAEGLPETGAPDRATLKHMGMNF
jgi:hypothetical protein